MDSVSGTITRTFDGLDRLTSETTPQGTVNYSYDAAGRRTSMTVAGQPMVNYSYDNANRPTQIAQGTSSVSFSYDAAGRRVSLTLPNGVVANYSYDTASQLTGLTYTLGSSVLGNLTYSYDLAGRRTQLGGSFARTGVPSALTSATYNAANQLTQWGATALAYDANGNLTNDGVNAYTWDPRNQLASISGGSAASFQYDPFGRRTSKTIGGVSTQFLYDDVNPVQELSGSTSIANLLTGLGLDEVFTRTDAVGARHFLSDPLRGVLALTDPAGTILTQYTYEPFGNATVSGATNGNPYQYTGRENDGTGLDFYRARYYSPTLERFISEDPIGIKGGANQFVYVGNNPISFADPLGLAKICSPIGSRRISPWWENAGPDVPLSDWRFIGSLLIEPEIPKVGPAIAMPLGSLVCRWEREVAHKVYRNAIFLTTYLCRETNCSGTWTWREFHLQKKTEYVRTERHRDERDPSFPASVESEAFNDNWCITHTQTLLPK